MMDCYEMGVAVFIVSVVGLLATIWGLQLREAKQFNELVERVELREQYETLRQCHLTEAELARDRG